jgi:hypothetical protein
MVHALRNCAGRFGRCSIAGSTGESAKFNSITETQMAAKKGRKAAKKGGAKKAVKKGGRKSTAKKGGAKKAAKKRR